MGVFWCVAALYVEFRMKRQEDEKKITGNFFIFSNFDFFDFYFFSFEGYSEGYVPFCDIAEWAKCSNVKKIFD